jgi:hypothetical protein
MCCLTSEEHQAIEMTHELFNFRDGGKQHMHKYFIMCSRCGGKRDIYHYRIIWSLCGGQQHMGHFYGFSLFCCWTHRSIHVRFSLSPHQEQLIKIPQVLPTST